MISQDTSSKGAINSTKCGFVALVGRPNAGKSTLLNALLGEKIAMVSQKANATRKRTNAIVMHKDAQIIFVDTPGLHQREKMLNQYMLEEALKAIGDADLILYLAPVTDSLEHYERFLEITKGEIPHILALTKIDQVSQERLFKSIGKYNKYSDYYKALIPLSVPKRAGLDDLLDEIVKYLPHSPYLFDPEDLTDELLRNIYKEFIREAIFENISDEVPYESDVLIDRIEEQRDIDRIYATIIVEKESQKGIVIGKGGEAIKRIGRAARLKIEQLSGKRCYLNLQVSVKKGWSKDASYLKKLGYEI